MKMNLIKSLTMSICSIALCAMLSSCTTMNKQALPAQNGLPAPPSEHNGRILIMTVIDGLSKDNYEIFTSKFTEDLKTRFTRLDFRSSVPTFKEKYGAFVSMDYLGCLKISGMDVMLWKAKFKNNKNDVLIRLILGKIDGEYRIFGWSIE